MEALDYDAEPDSDDEDEEEIAPEALEPLDEPDRWKRHVLAQGRRDAFVMPSEQSLSPALREELQHHDPAAAQARLEQLVLDQPATVEAYVLRAALAFPGGATPAVDGPTPSAAELADARRWYECAVTVGEQALHFFNGTLLWHEENNRPFLPSQTTFAPRSSSRAAYASMPATRRPGCAFFAGWKLLSMPRWSWTAPASNQQPPRAASTGGLGISVMPRTSV